MTPVPGGRYAADEAYYAERLCRRTGRLYRSLEQAATGLALMGTLGVLAAVWHLASRPVGVDGVGGLVAGLALLATVQPARRAAASESAARRYAYLRSVLPQMSGAEAALSLKVSHDTAGRQLAPLAVLAWNDYLLASGRPASRRPLTWSQRVLGWLS